MKIDISKKIITNTSKLKEEMCKFECFTNQKAYLFMNSNTMYSLVVAIGRLSSDATFDMYILEEYFGRKVFQNEDLPFGEVEIR